MQNIRAITLDLDDTLWAIAPVIARAEQKLWEWLERHYPRVTDHWDAAGLKGLRDEVIAEHAARSHDLRFLRETVLARMAQAAGCSADLVAPAFEVFDRERNTVELFPDVVPGLTQLAADFRLIALTNGNACLETIGIRELFDDVVTAAAAGAAKPDARIFEVAIERAAVPAGAILHVGDHPELDVDGAREAGLRTAWMNRVEAPWPDELKPPDVTVADLAELAVRLRAAAPARAAD